MSKPPPPAPTASATGPCPTVIQIVGHCKQECEHTFVHENIVGTLLHIIYIYI